MIKLQHNQSLNYFIEDLYLKIVKRRMQNNSSSQVWPFIINDEEIKDLISRKDQTDSFGSEIYLPHEQIAEGPLELFQSLIQDSLKFDLNTSSFFADSESPQKGRQDFSEGQPTLPQQFQQISKEKKIGKQAKSGARHIGRPIKLNKHLKSDLNQKRSEKNKRVQKNFETLQRFEQHSQFQMRTQPKAEMRQLSSDQIAYECFLDL